MFRFQFGSYKIDNTIDRIIIHPPRFGLCKLYKYRCCANIEF